MTLDDLRRRFIANNWWQDDHDVECPYWSDRVKALEQGQDCICEIGEAVAELLAAVAGDAAGR